MNNEEELDLNNPIFAFYINIDGLPRARAESEVATLIKSFGRYSNVTIWFVPIKQNDSRIECIYDGTMRISEYKKIKFTLDNTFATLKDSKNYEEFLSRMREASICDILD